MKKRHSISNCWTLQSKNKARETRRKEEQQTKRQMEQTDQKSKAKTQINPIQLPKYLLQKITK